MSRTAARGESARASLIRHVIIPSRSVRDPPAVTVATPETYPDGWKLPAVFRRVRLDRLTGALRLLEHVAAGTHRARRCLHVELRVLAGLAVAGAVAHLGGRPLEPAPQRIEYPHGRTS